LRPEERMALVSDQWALVRANAVTADAFLQLLASLKKEEDHTVLDEVVGRLAWLEHRGVETADRPALQAWLRPLFAGAGPEPGWEIARRATPPGAWCRAGGKKCGAKETRRCSCGASSRPWATCRSGGTSTRSRGSSARRSCRRRSRR